MEYVLIRVELPPDADENTAPKVMNDLIQRVNEALRSGWRPQGGICQYRVSYMTAFFNGETMEDAEVTDVGFIQAMVRD